MTEEQNIVSRRVVGDYKEALRETIKGYKAEGWLVDDEQMRSTRVPLREKTELLEMGEGVELISPDCGCRWRVNGDGTSERIFHCDDSECDGQPRHKPITPNEGPPKKIQFCGEHGRPMVWDAKKKRHRCSSCEVNE